jgi:hypothetical protein
MNTPENFIQFLKEKGFLASMNFSHARDKESNPSSSKTGSMKENPRKDDFHAIFKEALDESFLFIHVKE